MIEELIALAKDISAANARSAELGLNTEELAFYDALAENGSAKALMAHEQLRILAQVLVETIRSSATIDWTRKESVRAKMRIEVRKLLARYGYPPDFKRRLLISSCARPKLLLRTGVRPGRLVVLPSSRATIDSVWQHCKVEWQTELGSSAARSMKRTKRHKRHEPLIFHHLEFVSRRLLEEHSDIVRRVIGRNSGVYALCRKNRPTTLALRVG